MMRNPSCLATLFFVLFCACHQPQSAASSQPALSKQVADNITVGSWSGHYSKGILTLVINYISGSTVSGYDIHKGLRRNLNGTMEQKGGQLEFVLKEPGGNPYDGTFYLSFDTATSKISGKWVPTDATKAKAGPLEVSRVVNQDTRQIADGQWTNSLGTLSFGDEGVCTLEYYPGEDSVRTTDPNSQLVTIKGSYEMKGDTIRIDWQRNDRTPALNMKLIYHAGKEYTDSTEGSPPSLQGKGMKFEKLIAG